MKLGPSTISQLRLIERTPDPASHIAEVEDFIFGRGAATHLHEPRSAVLFADDAGTVIGAAVHYQDDEHVGCQYIGAILIDHRVRRQGFGGLLLDAVIADARERSGHEYVRWLVHPDNAPMVVIARSRTTTSEVGLHEGTGYIEFIDP